mgnify:FL=1
MQLSDIIAISGTILTSIGGGTAIVFGFSSYLGKIWANRLMENEKNQFLRELETLKNSFLKDSESHKIKLKKSELIFEKQFEAASELVALYRSFIPDIYAKHMDYEDFLDRYVFSSKEIEIKLKKYLAQHGAILGDDVESKLNECLRIAAWNKFEISPDYQPSFEGKDEAEKLYQTLSQAKELMIKKVHEQIST